VYCGKKEHSSDTHKTDMKSDPAAVVRNLLAVWRLAVDSTLASSCSRLLPVGSFTWKKVSCSPSLPFGVVVMLLLRSVDVAPPATKDIFVVGFEHYEGSWRFLANQSSVVGSRFVSK
ncbi:hypothetical protein F442_10483, partial [Phytophthora nicotianae P10297]